MQQLPTFKGYTVDVRLREFRMVERDKQKIEFIPFDSEKGDKLLAELVKKLPATSTLFQEIKDSF